MSGRLFVRWCHNAWQLERVSAIQRCHLQTVSLLSMFCSNASPAGLKPQSNIGLSSPAVASHSSFGRRARRCSGFDKLLHNARQSAGMDRILTCTLLTRFSQRAPWKVVYCAVLGSHRKRSSLHVCAAQSRPLSFNQRWRSFKTTADEQATKTRHAIA